MSTKPHDVTALIVVEYTRKLLRRLAGKYGSSATLNELRVMNQVVLCGIIERTCTVTSLHRVTGIPIPTVSRSVANLQSNGWLSLRPDPDDGRKRVISLGPRSLAGMWVHIDGRDQWITDFCERGLAS